MIQPCSLMNKTVKKFHRAFSERILFYGMESKSKIEQSILSTQNFLEVQFIVDGQKKDICIRNVYIRSFDYCNLI